MPEVSTARALEIILSRLPMDRQTASILAAHLVAQRHKPAPMPVVDADEIRARLHATLYHLDGCDPGFSKVALLGRIVDARAELRAALGTSSL
jgi:hypothetical protein